MNSNLLHYLALKENRPFSIFHRVWWVFFLISLCLSGNVRPGLVRALLFLLNYTNSSCIISCCSSESLLYVTLLRQIRDRSLEMVCQTEQEMDACPFSLQLGLIPLSVMDGTRFVTGDSRWPKQKKREPGILKYDLKYIWRLFRHIQHEKNLFLSSRSSKLVWKMLTFLN